MTRHVQTTTTPFFNCDQCGYTLYDCETEKDVAQKHVLLVVRGEHLHFHGTNEWDATPNESDVPVWDEPRACLQRWLTAQRHRAERETPTQKKVNP